MATFTTDVLKSQNKKDPNEVNDMLAGLQSAQNAVLKAQGRSQNTYDPFAAAKTQDQWGQGEQKRRVAAATGAAQTGSLIDERIAGAQNQMANIYNKYNQTNADLAQKQSQDAQTTDFSTTQALAGIQQQKNSMDFATYKNQAQRDDAIQAAWVQGIADDKMLQAATEHALKMQDVDKYFALIKNQLEQDMADWAQMTEQEWQKEKRKVETTAANNGAIIGGALGIVGSIVGYYYGGSIGAAAGGKLGSGLGEGISKITGA